MKSSINKFMGITALILTIVLIISITIISIYVTNNFDGSFNWSSGNNNWTWDLSFSWPWSDKEKSSDFDTDVSIETASFDIPENIVVDVSLNKVIFVEEKREDIYVEFYAQKPATDLYKIECSSYFSNKTLYIESSTTIKNLILDKKYDSYVKIHVPKDFYANSLDLRLALGDITNDSIIQNVDQLILKADLGDIDIDITSDKTTLSINASMGNATVNIMADVKSLDLTASMGDIEITTDGTIDTLWTKADMGYTEINAKGAIKHVDLDASMGSISCEFHENVQSMIANCNMGNIDVKLHKNSDSTVYAKSNMGKIDVNLSTVQENANPDFKLYADMGDITVKSK